MRIDYEIEFENVNVTTDVYGDVHMDFVSLVCGSVQLTSDDNYDCWLEGNTLSGYFKYPIMVFEFDDETGDGTETPEDEYSEDELINLIQNYPVYSFVCNNTPEVDDLLKDAKIKRASVTCWIGDQTLDMDCSKAILELNW